MSRRQVTVGTWVCQNDGQGYVVFLEDSTDREGYAAHSDERGVIWECKWLP